MDDTYTVTSSNQKIFKGHMMEQSSESSDEDKTTFEPSTRLSFSSVSSEMSDISKKMKVTEKSRPAPAVERPSYHSFVDMITNAVEDSKDSQGISLQAIKSYLKTNYDVDDLKIKRYLKKSMEKCIEEKIIIRCAKKGAKRTTGINGRFKINTPKEEKLSKPKKTERKIFPVMSVDVLKSAKRKSIAVKAAQNKVKLAKKTLRKSTNTKEPVQVKTLSTSKKFATTSTVAINNSRKNAEKNGKLSGPEKTKQRSASRTKTAGRKAEPETKAATKKKAEKKRSPKVAKKSLAKSTRAKPKPKRK